MSPVFAKRHNYVIWDESIRQASHLRRYLLNRQMSEGGIIDDMAVELHRLSLHVICRTVYGVPLYETSIALALSRWRYMPLTRYRAWPGDKTLDSTCGLRSRRSRNAHLLGFGNALNGVLDNLASIAVCSQRLLGQHFCSRYRGRTTDSSKQSHRQEATASRTKPTRDSPRTSLPSLAQRL